MNSDLLTRVSVLACVTGLLLVAMCLAAIYVGAPNPEWLPMLISAIAGFELFMVFDAHRQRRAGES